MSVSVHDLGLVFTGGAIGVGVRFALEAGFPSAPGGWPTTTFLINVIGSLALGMVSAWAALRGRETVRTRAIRLGVGTGVIGGFTTYSTFSVETVRLLGDSAPLGMAYAFGSIVLGMLAAFAGMRVIEGAAGRGRA